MPLTDGLIYIPGLGDGLPGTFALPGSGLSVPGGLECTFEYNGLFLNVRKNLDRYKVNSIDGLADPDVRDTRDVNTNSDGETPYNSFYGGRTIVISGTIDTYTIAKLRDMQQALRTAFSDLTTEYPLHFRTGNFLTDHVIYCKKINSSAMTEQQQNMSVGRDFQISLRASNPCFLSYYQKFVDIAPEVSMITPILLSSAVNSGNYKAQVIYRIYGPCSTATFINDLTDKSFTIENVPYGGYFEFNTGAPPSNIKYLIDNNGVNQWNNLTDDSQYVYLAKGVNNIFYIGDSPRVTMSWQDTWI